MLVATKLGCVRGNRILFAGTSFALEPGSLLQIDGVNGSGKTSLMRMLCGLLQPASGDIQWRGQSIRKQGEQFRAEVAYLSHSNAVKDELSALENLRISARLAGEEVSQQGACSALRRLGLQGCEDLPAKLLSQGQKRRVALARFLMTGKPLWLLDEPVASLDTTAMALLETMLEAHLARGGMVVLTTHQEVRTPCVSTKRIRLGE
jgi:heme exporter protein A